LFLLKQKRDLWNTRVRKLKLDRGGQPDNFLNTSQWRYLYNSDPGNASCKYQVSRYQNTASSERKIISVTCYVTKIMSSYLY